MRAISYEDLPAEIATGKDFIVQLGEQAGIGSSQLFFQICGKTGLLDSGLAFEGFGVNKRTALPVGGLLEGIHLDLIILSHIHLDHSGYIPPVVLAHPEARFVLSSKTLEEMRITLDDSLKIQQREEEKAHLLGLEMPVTLFTAEQITDFLSDAKNGCYEVVDVDNEDVCLTWEDWPGWKFGFTSSGHTSGAMWSFMVTPDNDCYSFTGDICSHDQENTNGVLMPKESFLTKMGYGTWRHTYLITEATNGNRNQMESREDMDARLKADIEDTFRRGGMVLCPVFMVNRGPNIVALLVRLGFKVFVAGGVRKTIYAEIEPTLLEKWLDEKRVILAMDGRGRKDQLRNLYSGFYGDIVIVSSSATLDQGASTGFAIQILGGRENLLVSTGHRFSGSKMEEVFKVKDQPLELGRTIVFESFDRYGKQVKTPVNFRCRAEHYDKSAHDYRKGLVARAVAMNATTVLVGHCTEDGFNGFKSGLVEKLDDNCPSIYRLSHLNLCEL